MRVVMMDVDGVLVRGRPSDGGHLFTDLEKDLGISVETLQAHFFAPHWPDIVTGRHPLKPVLERVLEDIAPSISADVLIDYWLANDSRIDLDVLDAMAASRKEGVRIFLATNQEHMRARYLMEEMGLRDHVDGIIYSAAIGYRKPSRDFYELATTHVDETPSDIVLIDDTFENVTAAKAFGWRAVHWKDGMQAASVLQNLTVQQ